MLIDQKSLLCALIIKGVNITKRTYTFILYKTKMLNRFLLYSFKLKKKSNDSYQ